MDEGGSDIQGFRLIIIYSNAQVDELKKKKIVFERSINDDKYDWI